MNFISMNVTNIDSYDSIYDEFKKWYNKNIADFNYYEMDEKQVAFAAWREGQRKLAGKLKK